MAIATMFPANATAIPVGWDHYAMTYVRKASTVPSVKKTAPAKTKEYAIQNLANVSANRAGRELYVPTDARSDITVEIASKCAIVIMVHLVIILAANVNVDLGFQVIGVLIFALRISMVIIAQTHVDAKMAQNVQTSTENVAALPDGRARFAVKENVRKVYGVPLAKILANAAKTTLICVIRGLDNATANLVGTVTIALVHVPFYVTAKGVKKCANARITRNVLR